MLPLSLLFYFVAPLPKEDRYLLVLHVVSVGNQGRERDNRRPTIRYRVYSYLFWHQLLLLVYVSTVVNNDI